jgi:polar amino acid transport system substrate-binding protein
VRKAYLLIGFAIAMSASISAKAREIEIFTIDAPPLTVVADEKHGILGDILFEAMKRAELQAKVTVLPWRRAQDTVEAGEDQLIIFARTAERDTKFTWIAPIFTLERTFATLGAPIDSIEQAKTKNVTIMVGQGTPQEDLLLKSGIDKEKLQRQAVGRSEVEMLVSGRADAWFNGTPETLWKWKQSGQSQKIVLGKAITADEMYVACSKKCSPDVVQPIAKAINAMKQDGTIKKITDGYLSSN